MHSTTDSLFTFTFSHLADAFIQSNIQRREQSSHQSSFSPNKITHFCTCQQPPLPSRASLSLSLSLSHTHTHTHTHTQTLPPLSVLLCLSFSLSFSLAPARLWEDLGCMPRSAREQQAICPTPLEAHKRFDVW